MTRRAFSLLLMPPMDEQIINTDLVNETPEPIEASPDPDVQRLFSATTDEERNAIMHDIAKRHSHTELPDTEPPNAHPAPVKAKSRLGAIVEADPEYKRMQQQEQGAADLTPEQRDRAEAAADTITDGVAGALMVEEIFSKLEGEGAVESALKWLEDVAATAEELEVPEVALQDGEMIETGKVWRYRLAATRKMNLPQIVDTFKAAKSIGVNIAAFSIDMEKLNVVLLSLTDGENLEPIRKLFACLYLGANERKYYRETVPKRLEHMDDLTVEQMAGALFRFFISRGLSVDGVIRICFKKLAMTLLQKMPLAGKIVVGQ